MTIEVVDAKGFYIQYDDHIEYRPANHRIVVDDNGAMYGVDNLISNFKDKKGNFNHGEWTMFVQLMTTLPSGSYGDLTWERE